MYYLVISYTYTVPIIKFYFFLNLFTLRSNFWMSDPTTLNDSNFSELGQFY